MTLSRLGERLRELRTTEFGESLTQDRVARALNVSSASISAWENGTTDPPPERLREYAFFFATRRRREPGQPGPVEADLQTDEERDRFRALLVELTRLANDTPQVAQRAAFWRFSDGDPVRIFCGRLPPEDAGAFADPRNHNYMHLRKVADLDALVDLFGYVRRLNPGSDVRYRIGREWRADDLQAHMVVLGNLVQLQGSGRLLPRNSLPIHQVRTDRLDGEYFERIDDGRQRYEPVFDDGSVVEDVGLLARVPNPYRTDRTLTVCSGVFTRGVYGAVRATTAEELRTTNVQYLRETYDGADSFAVLMRVRIAGSEIPTPDLRDRRCLLHGQTIT
ncbi:MAG: helix-turn-helix domain-containing protein [Actinomycetia bacterium]|nr:helix-turn-helix domain-containing protein [Actinomycetes bacterium]